MSEVATESASGAANARTVTSPARAWMRALELTAPIAKNRDRILPTVILEAAERFGDAPALLSNRESFTYRELAGRVNQYARWALAQNIAKGEVVCLLMPNRPEYMAIWLGLTSVGVVVSLLNTNLVGPSLAHCINAVVPQHIVADSACLDALSAALSQLNSSPQTWTLPHSPTPPEICHFDRRGFSPAAEKSATRHAHPSHDVWPAKSTDLDVAHYSGAPLGRDERVVTEIEDIALYIYTSGTTGLPKAAKITHARIMQWSHWFAGMMDVSPADRMYNCLPMYHSVGGVQAAGAMLVGGGSVVVRERFSASHFWSDILRSDCTLFQYIGELCRYLLHTAPSQQDTQHRIRLACGNGLSPEIWKAFKHRFRIPHILEFYAATEGNVSLFNVEGRPGSIGHIPAYLAHRFSPALVVFDVQAGEPIRDKQGFRIRCGPGQIGEALGKIVHYPSNIGSHFDGYSVREDSEKKILRDVFESGDAWFRTGDLMRRDEEGFFYFVDRIGDTFRRKGENVATSEVSAALCAFPGVTHATVYGVALPGTEGRVGMAAIVADEGLDFARLREHLTGRLPSYAQPVFLRVRKQAEVTGTFKYSKTELARQGYDPSACDDPLYFDHPELGAFVRLNGDLYDRIQSGGFRL